MTELPRVSIRLHGGLSTAQCVERAKLADAAGFHGVWFAENPFSRSVLPAASACAVATGRLAIGLGVLNPFNRHPTLMAMEVAALDEASNGRVIVGVGAAAPALVRAMGQKWERPLTAVRESVDIVKKLLAGETVTAHGQVFSVDGVKLEMELCRPAVPVYIGGVSNATLRICGEVGDGLNISNMCPPGYAAHALAVVRAGAQAVGRPAPADAVQYMPCAVSKDRQAARRTAKATVGALLSLYTRLYAELPGVQAGLLESSGIEPAHFRATVERLSRGEPAVDVLDDHFVETYALAGTVDDVLARAARYGAGGVTELALTFLGEDPAASMRAVAEAMPRV